MRLAGWFSVPSLDHEVLVELFRSRADLARELLRRCAGIDLAGIAEAGSIDLSQVAPAEYRADSVSIVRGATGRPIAATITEVQLRIDAHKRRSWPLYVAALHARLGCPVHLLVLAPNAKTAAWARRPIRLGPAGFDLVPTVIDFATIPRITDFATAIEFPELAMLSGLAHREVEIARPAAAAIRTLDEDHRLLYLDVLLKGFPVEMREQLETHMIKDYVYRTAFVKALVKKRDEARERARKKAVAEGRAEGRAVMRAAIIEIARAKIGVLSKKQLASISVASEARLVRLILALGRATDAAAARRVLATRRTTKRSVAAT